jgi:YVTN family beta-propeller protein
VSKSRISPLGAATLIALTVLLLLPAGLAGSRSAIPPAVASSAGGPVPRAASASNLPSAGPVRDYHLESVELARPGWSGTPAWLAYDHDVRAFYVAEAPSGLGVISVGQPSPNVTIPVGNSPFGVAYDPTDARVFVTNTGSGNVTAISDATNASVGSVNVQADPRGIAFDDRTDQIFVANGGSNSVTVVDAATLGVVANVSVGGDPVGVAVDPVSGFVFVANFGSSNVSVLNATTDTVAATRPSGYEPYAVAVDNVTGEVYVTNSGAGNVSVFTSTGTSLVATIPVGLGPAGLTYDSQNGTVWVDQGPIGVVVINATSNQVVQIVNFDPQGAAFDPDANEVCVTNAANATFECLVSNTDSRTFANTATFTESGLPNGTPWEVVVGGVQVDSTNSSIVLALSPYLFYEYTVGPVSQYSPTPSSGSWSSGGAQNFSITFTSDPGLYVVTFQEVGIVLGWVPPWEVNVSNLTYGSDLVSFALGESNGTYAYLPQPYGALTAVTGSVTVNGTDVTVFVDYAPATFPVQFTEEGLPSGQSWSVTFNGSQSTATTNGRNDTLAFPPVPNGSYPYSVAAVPGWEQSNLSASGSIAIAGSALDLVLEYVPAPPPPPPPSNATYFVSFVETGLPFGTEWLVLVPGAIAEAATDTSTFLSGGPNGTYNYSVWPVAGYTATPSSGSLTIAGRNQTIPIAFAPAVVPPVARYAVTFAEAGLPDGASWSLEVDGATNTSDGPWITFAEENGTHAFSIAPKPGFDVALAAGDFVVQGVPLTVWTNFTPVAAPVLYPVDFTEVGLPSGMSWTVQVNGQTETTASSELGFSEPNGTYTFVVFAGVIPPPTLPYGGSVLVNGTAVVVPLPFPLPNGSPPGGLAASSSSAPPWYVDVGVGAAVAIGVAALVLALRNRPGPGSAR